MKCPKCGNKMGKKKNAKIEVVLLNEKDIEFLKESNAIEKEYSDEALEDSKTAYQVAFRKRKIVNVELIKEIHFELMKNLNKRIAGKIRRCRIYVGNAVNYRECMKPKKIKKELENWCLMFNKNVKEDYKDWKNQHIWFEKIHPFEDGNGRVGRILMNIQRLNMGLPILIIHEGKEQYDYYKWFKKETATINKANNGGETNGR